MKRLGFIGTCAAAVVVLGLGLGQAGAVVYTSSFDPPNFRGTATFDVSPACLGAGNGFQSNGVAGCSVTWIGASVTFQNAPTLTFNYAGFLPDPGVVDLIWVEDGELAGVVSDAIGAVIISGNANPTFDGPWWIQFAFAPPSDATILDGPPANGLFGLGVVYLYTGICGLELGCVRNPDPVEVAQVEFFRRVAQVAEPGSIALSLTALAVAGMARRRRKPAA